MDNSIAILVEGAAEEAVIKVLLENEKLIFNKNELIDDGPLRIRNSKKFERHVLDFGFTNTFDIYRILDSKKENFSISKEFRFKVGDIYNLYTTPEIEMLFIIYFGEYDVYTRHRSGIKPSEFVKNKHPELGNFKSRNNVYNFWSTRPDELVNTIREYSRISNLKQEQTISSILID